MEVGDLGLAGGAPRLADLGRRVRRVWLLDGICIFDIRWEVYDTT